MARADKQLAKELEALLREAGAVIKEHGRTRGGHCVIRWELGGRGQVSFYANTASDRRTHMNTVAMVRRQIRMIQD